MSYNSLLIHRCDIMRRTYLVADSHGQPGEVFAAAYSSIPCRLTQQIGFLGVQGAEYFEQKRVTTHEDVIFFPKGTVVLGSDRITNILNTNGTVFDNGPFDVMEVRVHSDSKTGHHIECTLNRIKVGGT